MKRLLLLGLAAATVVFVPASHAFRTPDRASLPNYDKRHLIAPALPVMAPGRAEAAAALKNRVQGMRVDIDPILGSPHFVASSHGFLSGPNGAGKGISDRFRQAVPAQDAHPAVKAFLNEHSAVFGHGAEVLDSAKVTRDYVTEHNGLKTTIWEQQVDDIPVFQGLLISHVTKNGELVNIASQFVPDPAKAANKGVRNRAAAINSPTIAARQALVAAVQNLGDLLPDNQITPLDAQPNGPHKQQRFTARSMINGEADARLVWLAMSGDELRLCWQLILTSRARGEMFRVLVDSETGEVLVRHSLTRYISNASYRVFTSDSPSPMSPGLPVPGTAQPALVQQTLVVTNAINTNASPNGWINDADNETRGNNADAHLDRDADDQPDLPRPRGNPNRVFDFPLNLTQTPTNYGDSAVVQLFYWNNFMHDKLYELGFTEAAGNYQNTNFNRGGVGNDAVQADAQDGSGTDNANFSAPPDGFAGRMQMYVFTSATPNRDGDFDAEVVLHEYTHGLSQRLVGGGSLISALQTDGMGEGWSDFYAISLLSEPGDDPNATYAAGGYVSFDPSGFSQNYYFGARHYPYCTDTNKNPFTFKDIDPEQAIPHTGVPINPSYGFSPFEADEVHHQGEVWCVTLWDARALLIAKYGFAVGNRLMLQLVTDGMKLCPVNPNFLQSRDAIIQADLINNGGANFNELWTAFAKRGMGGSATSPVSATTSGIEEAFDLPGLALKQAVAVDLFTGNGNGAIDVNECNELNIILVNNGRNVATGVRGTIVTTTPGVLISQGDAVYADINSGATGTNTVPFRFYTSPGFVCGTVIEFNLTITSAQDTRRIKIHLNTGLVGSPVSYTSTSPTAIPDSNGFGVDSPITVSGFNSAVAKITVSLHALHPRDFDLAFTLISPDGTRVSLSRNQGFFGANYGTACSPESSRTVFDDKATTPINFASPPFVGVFKPEQALSKFVGKSGSAINGTWKLHVTDSFFLQTGTLQCWSLNLSPTECTDGGGDCGTDLALLGSFRPQVALVNSNLTYTYAVTNRGPNTARNVTLNDVLPPGLNFVSSTTTSGSCIQGGGQVICSLGTMTVSGGATVTITVLPTLAGNVTNIATVSTTVTDLQQTNNTSTLITQVLPPSPVIIAAGTRLISESTAPANGGIDPGETVTIDFAMQNVGTLPTANLVATLQSSSSISAPSAAQTYGALPPGGNTVTNRYTFTANGLPGSTISAVFQLQDGTKNLGNIAFPFTLANIISLTNPTVIQIPDSGIAGPYPSSIPVSGVAGLINKVTVTLPNMNHTSPDDLDILLVGPNGQSVMLMSDAGGGAPLNNVTLTFDDAATDLLPDESIIASGIYLPSDYPPVDLFPAPAPAAPGGSTYGTSLSIFNSINPNGLWSLYVLDDAAADFGRISGGWILTISTFDPVNPTADLAVFGTASPQPVTYGSNILYSFTVTNLGPQSASGIVFSNQIPVGSTFVSAGGPGIGCSNVNGNVVCGIGTLTNRGKALINIQVTTARTGTLTDIARVSGSVDDYNIANNTVSLSSSVNAAADLKLAMVAQPPSGTISNNLSLVSTVTNLGPDNATSVVVSNVLPVGVTFVSATASQGSCNNNAGTVVCNIGGLLKNASATVTVVIRPNSVGTLLSSASVTASQPVDLVSANNKASVSINVNNPALIIVGAGSQLLAESFPPATGGIDPGETVTLNLGLRNLGTSNTTSLVGILRATGGVTTPSTPQVYGVLEGQGSAVSKPFTFVAAGAAGSTINATLDVADVAPGQSNSLGSVQFSFVLGATRRFSNTTSNSIPDNSSAAIYPSQIQVSGLSGVVSHVSVTLSNLTHAYPDDLDILLVAPGGHSVMLMSDVGGSSSTFQHITLILDDDASASLSDNGPITSGTYKPTDVNGGDGDVFPDPAPLGPFGKVLSVFNGIDPNGSWSLFARDDAFGDLGNIAGGWSLNITTAGSVPHLVNLRSPRVLAGRFQCSLEGAVGDTLSIQGSTDLRNWTNLGNVSVGAAGTALFQENSAIGAYRFYRAVQQ